jgi:hypothetical protein
MRARLLLLPLLLLPTYSGKAPRTLLGAPDIRAEQVVWDPSNPANRKAGALTFLGGVRLTSRDTGFGGFSTMSVQGDRFTLVSDTGTLVRFRMGADWQPREIFFGDLPGGPRTSFFKTDRDAESMAVDPATGRVWVAFEVVNEIWRYSPGLAKAESHAWPRQMRDWGITGGAESMVRLRDGSFIVLAESSGWPGQPGRAAIRFTADPAVGDPAGERFSYVPPNRTHPTDMAELPDGRLLILNRGFSLADFFTATLTLADRKEVRRGGVVRAPEIARIASPLIRDNFEGIAATREGDAMIVWLLSDDNHEAFEQTLLLKFRLEL